MATIKDVISLGALTQVIVERSTIAAFVGSENEKSINAYQKLGLLVKVGHGRYKLFETVQNICRYRKRQAEGRIGKEETVDAVKANADLKTSQKELNDLRIAKMRGELVPIDDVKTAWDDVALGVKQLFMAFPQRARFDLPHLTGADQKVLERLARDMLDELQMKEGEPPMPKTVTVNKRGPKSKTND